MSILIAGVFIAYYFLYNTTEVVSSEEPLPTEVISSDNSCEVDADCVMAMVECSSDCGVPINKIHWQEYLDEQEKKCEFYSGKMCKMSCEQELKCINKICTNIQK